MKKSIFTLIIGIITYSTTYSQFTKITNDPIVTDVSESLGLAWGDYNNDGFDDLFVSVKTGWGPINNTVTNQLFKNNGDGTFSRITDSVLSETGRGRSAAWGDYDNDGNIDLYVVNSGSAYLYRNIGDGTFEKITTGEIVDSDGMERADSNGAAWGDYNNDGYLDLFVSNIQDNNFLFSNNKNGTFTKETGLLPAIDSTHSSFASWIDVNNDGSLDLMVSNYSENDVLYLNDGPGTFIIAENSGLTNFTNPTVGSSWADYDNDGDFDVFVANNVNRGDQFFDNNGDGTFTEVHNEVTMANIQASSSSWSDFDNDGLIDLALVSNEGNYIFRNTGDGFEDVSVEWGITDVSFALSVSSVDYNKDGFMDLYIGNQTDVGLSNQNILYQNTVNDNNWISIKLIGVNSNKSAIGSNIRLKTANGWQMRSIQSQTGPYAQNSLNASFGIGAFTTIDTILVEWPLKGYQELTNTSANQFLEITEINFPEKPSNLNTEYLATNSVNLSWSDNADTEAGYRIERSMDAKNFTLIAETDANTVEYVDNNLKNGTKYFYRISAMTNGGYSCYSQVAEIFIKYQQTIAFDPIVDLAIHVSEFTLSASTSSNLEVLYFISKGEDKVSIENNIVSLLDTGEVEIGAYSLGNDKYFDSDTLYQSFTIFNPLAVTLEQQSLIDIYPNPSAESLTISVPVEILDQEKNILMTSVDGKIVYSQPLIAEKTTIDLTRLPNGIYIIRIDNWYKRVLKTDLNSK